jgi:hypothetical protein
MFKIMLHTVFAALLLMPATSRAQEVTTAVRQPAGIVADGLNGDWQQPHYLYDAPTGLFFCIGNDSTRLYLCFTNNDERKITKLMKAGWDINVYSKEKRARFSVTLSFAGVAMITDPGRDEGLIGAADPGFQNKLALYRLNSKQITATGLTSGDGILPLKNTAGISAGMGSDSTRKFILEVSVPFSLLTGKPIPPGAELGLQVTVHGLKKPAYHGDPDGKDLVGKKVRRKGSIGVNGDDPTFLTDRSLIYTTIDFKQPFRLAGPVTN